MKLKSARIKNFKLLRDVTLEFSDDQQRPLTVIRAENGSGKTSTLVALRWVLYGEEGLDEPGMRLSPTTWPEGSDCEISVQLDFSHTLFNQIAGESVASTTDYRLVRSTVERPEGNRPNRKDKEPILFCRTEVGLEKIEPPDLRIAEILPIEMKDIFFTDGDAAMSFVSPHLTRSSKRNQVKDAIRSLLGLDLLESASTHIAGAQRKYNSEVSKASESQHLTDLANQIINKQERLDENSERLRDVERQVKDLARRYEEADKRLLQVALQAGDFNELAHQQKLALNQLKEARSNEAALKDTHQQVLQDQLLSVALLGRRLNEGFTQLVQLHDAGIIPSGSVPVLEERLKVEICVCGTDLSEGTAARANLEELITRQRTVDQKRKGRTELYHASKADLQRGVSATKDWLASLEQIEKTRLINKKAENTAKEQRRIYEEKLTRNKESGVEEKRKERNAIQSALAVKKDERSDLQISVEGLTRNIAELKPDFEKLRRQEKKGAIANARLTVTEDMRVVVQGALGELQQKYLSQVSDRMNVLFLEMVGADPSAMAEEDDRGPQSDVFRSAEISSDFEVRVNSFNNRTLNPDSELNGASKRALTFSFIWALTEVSQVTAPRIIDTPLGMMSGAVKKRVIELITASSDDKSDVGKQVVLFLTRDEIRGIEDVIDERAGRVFTFTNSDHYPVDVVNDPEVGIAEILRCACDHRHFCSVCARNNDGVYELTEQAVV